ncbi:MAG: caspase family protein [Methylocystis sp.]
MSTWTLSGGSASLAAPSGSARTALLIANENYADRDIELPTPVADAEKLAEALKRLGFRTQVERNVLKKPMEDAIESFLNRVEPGSVAVFFFAGYGIQVGGKNYLIPIDPRRIWNEADVANEGVSVDDIESKLAKRDAKARIIILEAARRNPFERRFRSVSSGLAPSSPEPGLVRFYSAVNAIVADAPNSKNSLFIDELVRQLRADGHAPKVFESTRDEVSRQSNNQQKPYLVSGLAEPVWLDAAQKPAGAPTEPPKTEHADISAKPVGAPVDRPMEPPPKPVAFPSESKPRHETPVLHESPKSGTEAALPVIKPYTPSEAARKAELDARIANNPTDEASLTERGQLLAVHREYKSALLDFEESTRLNPGNAQSWNNRCWVRAIVDELARALDDCNEALKQRPNFADALDSRGLVYLKQGNAEAALADYTAALRVNPVHPSALYGRGLAQSRLGKEGDAEVDIAKAKRIDPAIEQEFDNYGLK